MRLARSVPNSPFIQGWARLGFAIGGVVYVLIGVIALIVAIENHGQASGPQGAIERIGAQPFGHILLLIVVIGLFGYALWCFIQALFDIDHDGSHVKGVLVRIGEFSGGLGYVALAVFAIHRMLGSYERGDMTQHWSSVLLRHAWGPWLIGFVGFVLLGAGINQMIYAKREKFREHLRLAGASGVDRRWIVQFGKWGYSAQGVVMCMIGAFLVNAAIHSDAHQAHGLDGALQALAHQTYGTWMLGVVAAGLTAYGLFMFVQARYRRLA